MAQANDQQTTRTIVDCDVHTAYRTETIRNKIADRLEEPYKSYLTKETLNYGPYPRDSFPKEGLMSSGGTTEGAVVETPEDIEEDLCEGFGVDVAILNSLQKFDLIPQRERARREMRAVNDVFVEHFLEGHDEFFGLAMLQTQDPAAAAEEIDRMGAEDDIVGALILNGPSDKPLGDPKYDIIYRAAEDNDLPLVFHSSAVGYAVSKKFPFMYNDLQHYGSLHGLSHPFANMVTVTSLIMNGVPEKFPGLDFVFLEQDIGIVPLLMHRLNRETNQQPYEVPLLDKAPEEYIRDQFYWGTQPMPEAQDNNDVRKTVDLIGPDNIVFTTDHPHSDFDDPSSVVNKYFSHLSEEDQDKIMYKNADRVFGLGL
ncbi:amidohydrolase family protein [Natrinema soli]|uniref:Amidohydrolase family protein n=1 Tax=Natrinema soli TaxID=1930624 RepID=A0ABD5SNK9_9EURY|nr:amidohydrolase family protein [Natrinema soli]